MHIMQFEAFLLGFCYPARIPQGTHLHDRHERDKKKKGTHLHDRHKRDKKKKGTHLHDRDERDSDSY